MTWLVVLIPLFWFIRTTKVVLFYLYLWQLKEYHVDRFLDHFRTTKGKRLLFNYLIKGALLMLILLGIFWWERMIVIVLWLTFSVYLAESIAFLRQVFYGSVRKPVVTQKMRVLITGGILLEILILGGVLVAAQEIAILAVGYLLFDILMPGIVSLLVLLFQIPTVLLRNKIIEKATEKRKQFPNLVVVGITGSYGKTSTKEFLATILSEKYTVLKTEKHQNSETGISQCILDNLEEKHDIFVVEMGAYNKRKIRQVCDIAAPRIGILTGINEQHMALFGSQENTIEAKFELPESLPSDGTAILNGDSKYVKSNSNRLNINNKKVCSIREKLDVWAEEIKVDKEWIDCRISSKDGDSALFRINLFGVHNLINIVMAACCAKELGMSLQEIARACKNIKPEDGSMQLLKGRQGLQILDASYSANPDGVIADLEYLKLYSGRKVIVMPCLIELGTASKEVHERIGRKIGEICDLAIITTKERFEEVRRSAQESGMQKENIVFLENSTEILHKIKGDVVLLEGRVPKEVLGLL